MNQVLNARLRGREFWVGQVKKLMRKRVVNTFLEIISNLQTRCKNNKKKLRYLYPSSPFLILCHIYLCLYTHTHTHKHTHADMCAFVYFFNSCENRIRTSSFFNAFILSCIYVYFLRIRIFCYLTTVSYETQ